MSKTDPLAAALAAAQHNGSGGPQGKVMQLFGERPQVLDEIRRCRFDKKFSYAYIAELLTGGLPGDESICSGSVKNWLAKHKPPTDA